MIMFIIQSLFDKEVKIIQENKSLLWHFQQEYIDWMQACGGKGRCTTCKVQVIKGQEYLQDLTDAEEKFLEQGRLNSYERLACQTLCKITEEEKQVIIKIPKQYRFPHITYFE